MKLNSMMFYLAAGVALLAAALPGGLMVYQRLTKGKLAVPELNSDDLIQHVQGKSFLIVGGTKGIGHAIAEALAKRGAKVTATGRTQGRLPKSIEFVQSDVGTLKGSKQLGQELLKGKQFDTVIFTVGIFAAPTLQRNEEGVEQDLATSYLSRFIVANDLLKSNALVGRKRIFIMGYPGEDLTPTDLDDINFERTEYKAMPAHMNTVIFNEALVFELAKRYPDTHVFGLKPGIIQTNIRDNFHGGKSSLTGKAIETVIGWTQPTAEHYAETVVLPLVASPELEKQTAVSFTKDGAFTSVSKWMSDPKNRERVWQVSEALTAKVLGK